MPIPCPRLAAVAAACLLLAACGKSGVEAQGRQDGDRPIPVTTTIVRWRDFPEVLQALGTARARESVTLTAKVSETVQSVDFESGDLVRAGAPLVTLSGQAQQAALAEAQAAASEAGRLYRRQGELAAQQLIARASLDTQRAARDAATARVAQIRAQLGDRTIRAPFSGVIGLRQVSPGALIAPGTVIATLDDLARMQVDFPVPEAMLGQVAAGQPVAATVAAWPGRTFNGTVAAVAARVDAATRAATVRADLPNPDRALRPGMLVEVRLQLAQRRALLVPEIAIVQVGADAFVYRVKPDARVEQVAVTIGSRRQGMVEIRAGLRAGDRIVVDGTGKLRPGLQVTDAPSAPRPPAAAAAAGRGRG